MVTVERSALVGYSATDLYSLVEDVEAYPDFLPWCAAAQVISRDGASAIVTLDIHYRGLRQRFTTRNTFATGERIAMSLVDGPFRSLDGEWRFTPLRARACRVDLTLAYELRSALLARIMGPTFDQIANTFVDAFVQRADELYAAR